MTPALRREHPTTIMDNSTPAPFLPNECYTLFRFCLRPAATNGRRQSVRNLGEFSSVERAFEEARGRAIAELNGDDWAPTEETDGADEELEVHSTEWGYDLKRGHETLSRFWVHARPMSFSPGNGI